MRNALIAAFLGIATTLAANFVVAGRLTWTPGGYGIVFGRMLQDGIVDRYLEDHCPQMSLKLCPFRHQLPHDANAFLWGKSVFDELGRFDGLSEEMRTIVLGSLWEYPALQVTTALRATARQLVSIGTGEGIVTRLWHTYGIIERYTPSMAPDMRRARQQHGELHFRMLNLVHVPIGLLAMVILPVLIVIGDRRAAFAQFGLLAATVMLALVLNSVVCGVLSNPHDRYGARLIWVAPLTVALASLSIAMRGRRKALREPAWVASLRS